LSRWSRGGVVAELNHKKFSSAVQMIWSLRGVDGSGSSAHTQHLSHTSPPPQPPSCHASSSRLWRCHVPLRRPAALHSPSASAAVLTHPVRRGASSPRQLSGRAAGRPSTTTASTATASKSWRSPTRPTASYLDGGSRPDHLFVDGARCNAAQAQFAGPRALGPGQPMLPFFAWLWLQVFGGTAQDAKSI